MSQRLVISPLEEKEKINFIIINAFKEITPKSTLLDNRALSNMEWELDNLLRALQSKNKIYDYAVLISRNPFICTIAYNLINSDEEEYQGLVEIKF